MPENFIRNLQLLSPQNPPMSRKQHILSRSASTAKPICPSGVYARHRGQNGYVYDAGADVHNHANSRLAAKTHGEDCGSTVKTYKTPENTRFQRACPRMIQYDQPSLCASYRVAAATRFTISATAFHFFRMAGFFANFAGIFPLCFMKSMNVSAKSSRVG